MYILNIPLLWSQKVIDASCCVYTVSVSFTKYTQDSNSAETGLPRTSNTIPSRGLGPTATSYPSVPLGWDGSTRDIPHHPLQRAWSHHHIISQCSTRMRWDCQDTPHHPLKRPWSHRHIISQCANSLCFVGDILICLCAGALYSFTGVFDLLFSRTLSNNWLYTLPEGLLNTATQLQEL